MRSMKIVCLVFSLFITLAAQAKSNGVAKVIQVKGKVYNLDTKKRLKKNQWIPQGATILTRKKSFVKLLFIDKSKMSLGPASKMKISKFPKKEAGIISLMKGQLRSKVTKNYLEMKDKEKSKLFIKTKTAAMGVRGTDFQVNYNPINENTSLITFEGRVVMNALSEMAARSLDQRVLETVVSAPTAVAVTQGQFSGVLPKVNTKPLAPVKINKKQLKILESNDGSKDSSLVDNKNKKPQKKMAKRSVLPPGVQGADFAGASKKEIIDQVATVDSNMAKEMSNQINRKPAAASNQETPEVRENNGLSPGGFVDTTNGLYIPPPKSAAIDPITNEVIMPEIMGNFDETTGEYKNEFFDVNPDGTFVAKQDSPLLNENNRGPASVNNSSADATVNNVMPKMNVMDMMKEDMMKNSFENQEFDMKRDPNSIGFNPDGKPPKDGGLMPDGGDYELSPEEMEEIAERAANDATKDVEDNIEDFTDAVGERTRVKINVRVE